jgi:hypothetical protein
MSQENDFTEVKHRKMPRVARWTELPLKSGQTAVISRECVSRECKQNRSVSIDCVSASVEGVCLGSVNIVQGNSAGEQNGYEVIRVNVDSGAIDSCIPPNVASMFKVRSTKMSENGGYYTSASGGVIYNEGERDVKGVTDDAQELSMTFQEAHSDPSEEFVRQAIE